jgi:hypothetical protein
MAAKINAGQASDDQSSPGCEKFGHIQPLVDHIA